MEDNEDDAAEDPDISQHLSEAHLQHRWPEKIRNEELWERAGQEPAAKQILRRKWGWIGHTPGSQHPAPHAKP
nr:hypothetical protein BaRGS_032456 [Batillaria attramentaria]